MRWGKPISEGRTHRRTEIIPKPTEDTCPTTVVCISWSTGVFGQTCGLKDYSLKVYKDCYWSVRNLEPNITASLFSIMQRLNLGLSSGLSVLWRQRLCLYVCHYLPGTSHKAKLIVVIQQIFVEKNEQISRLLPFSTSHFNIISLILRPNLTLLMGTLQALESYPGLWPQNIQNCGCNREY